MSISNVCFKMAQDLYQKSRLIALASGESYLLARYMSPLKLRPAETALFTGIACALYVLSTSFFKEIEAVPGQMLVETKEKTKNNLSQVANKELPSRLVVIALLAYGVHSMLNPDKTLISLFKLGVMAAATYGTTKYLYKILIN